MAHIVDRGRLAKLQCIICGSRDKKIIHIQGINSEKDIGYATLCCNCGHTEQFALTSAGVAAVVVGDTTKVGTTIIECAIAHPKLCPVKGCKYRPKPPEDCETTESEPPYISDEAIELSVEKKYL